MSQLQQATITELELSILRKLEDQARVAATLVVALDMFRRGEPLPALPIHQDRHEWPHADAEEPVFMASTAMPKTEKLTTIPVNLDAQIQREWLDRLNALTQRLGGYPGDSQLDVIERAAELIESFHQREAKRQEGKVMFEDCLSEVSATLESEREACAEIAEQTTERPDDWDVPRLIASRIRERGPITITGPYKPITADEQAQLNRRSLVVPGIGADCRQCSAWKQHTTELSDVLNKRTGYGSMDWGECTAEHRLIFADLPVHVEDGRATLHTAAIFGCVWYTGA